MTTEQQIKALAELDGWNHWFNGWNKLDDNTPPLTLSQDLPCYLTSYDAIIPLIQKQPLEVVDWINKRYNTLTASPDELCEALLRATNRWVK